MTNSYRTSSQKPGDALLANFREQFPQVGTSGSSTAAPAPEQSVAVEDPPFQQSQSNPARYVSLSKGSRDYASASDLDFAPSRIDLLIEPGDSHPPLENEAFRDQDPTPRASHEPWRFTPSMLDPNSFSFNNFANGPMGYYTPNSGGSNTLFHPQAGDLHTPTMGMGPGLATPLSMPTSGESIPSGAGIVDMTGFHTLPPHQLHHFNPFVHVPPPQPSFAPSSFVHQDTGYETMEQDGSPLDSDPSDERMNSIDSKFQQISPSTFPQHLIPGAQLSNPLPASAERFQFHSTLNAPTAMIKHADEIPITYLNKGQAYSLSIVDTGTTMPIVPGTKYRTFVRVSFEDEEQRQKPGVCWGLWKEGRGTNEAHQRGGKLQAVEFVEAGQPVEGDEKRTRVELEYSSFDGFSVVWTPGLHGAPDVNIAVRFNFLSTDFSHSKGVKGIPVRLCSKTTPVSPTGSHLAPDTNPEICFCKVKLFRDHGAERKLSNDVAHVKKSIDKLKQQIAQMESGMKDFGKRKRSSGPTKLTDAQKPGKVQKHKRTWSMSSASSAGGGGGRMSVEEDLHFKLQTLQDMFTSTRPVSVLYLRGEERDDPDLHPVSMPGDSSPNVKAEAASWQARSHPTSSITDSMVSPLPSSPSLASQASAAGQGMNWQKTEIDSVADAAATHKGSDQPTRINRTDESGNLSGWIEALDVNTSYRPPPEQTPKPVACFYIKRQDIPEAGTETLYRAIYLMQRTLKDFNHRIAAKWGIDPSKILRTTHMVHDGLEVELDDDVVQELREGQDMKLDIRQVIESAQPAKREWEMTADSTDEETNKSPAQGPQTKTGIVLRLTF
jgi:hypothetical protein